MPFPGAWISPHGSVTGFGSMPEARVPIPIQAPPGSGQWSGPSYDTQGKRPDTTYVLPNRHNARYWGSHPSYPGVNSWRKKWVTTFRPLSTPRGQQGTPWGRQRTGGFTNYAYSRYAANHYKKRKRKYRR